MTRLVPSLTVSRILFGNKRTTVTDLGGPDLATQPTENGMLVDQWLAIREEAGLKIDPVTAKVTFNWRRIADPYGMISDLTEEEQVVGRVYSACSPDSDIWVCVDDLPKETRDELWEKLDAGAYDDRC